MVSGIFLLGWWGEMVFLEGVIYYDGIIVFRVSVLIYCVDFLLFVIELLKKM